MNTSDVADPKVVSAALERALSCGERAIFLRQDFLLTALPDQEADSNEIDGENGVGHASVGRCQFASNASTNKVLDYAVGPIVAARNSLPQEAQPATCLLSSNSVRSLIPFVGSILHRYLGTCIDSTLAMSVCVDGLDALALLCPHMGAFSVVIGTSTLSVNVAMPPWVLPHSWEQYPALICLLAAPLSLLTQTLQSPKCAQWLQPLKARCPQASKHAMWVLFHGSLKRMVTSEADVTAVCRSLAAVIICCELRLVEDLTYQNENRSGGENDIPLPFRPATQRDKEGLVRLAELLGFPLPPNAENSVDTEDLRGVNHALQGLLGQLVTCPEQSAHTAAHGAPNSQAFYGGSAFPLPFSAASQLHRIVNIPYEIMKFLYDWLPHSLNQKLATIPLRPPSTHVIVCATSKLVSFSPPRRPGRNTVATASSGRQTTTPSKLSPRRAGNSRRADESSVNVSISMNASALTHNSSVVGGGNRLVPGAFSLGLYSGPNCSEFIAANSSPSRRRNLPLEAFGVDGRGPSMSLPSLEANSVSVAHLFKNLGVDHAIAWAATSMHLDDVRRKCSELLPFWMDYDVWRAASAMCCPTTEDLEQLFLEVENDPSLQEGKRKELMKQRTSTFRAESSRHFVIGHVFGEVRYAIPLSSLPKVTTGGPVDAQGSNEEVQSPLPKSKNSNGSGNIGGFARKQKNSAQHAEREIMRNEHLDSFIADCQRVTKEILTNVFAPAVTSFQPLFVQVVPGVVSREDDSSGVPQIVPLTKDMTYALSRSIVGAILAVSFAPRTAETCSLTSFCDRYFSYIQDESILATMRSRQQEEGFSDMEFVEMVCSALGLAPDSYTVNENEIKLTGAARRKLKKWEETGNGDISSSAPRESLLLNEENGEEELDENKVDRGGAAARSHTSLLSQHHPHQATARKGEIGGGIKRTQTNRTNSARKEHGKERSDLLSASSDNNSVSAQRRKNTKKGNLASFYSSQDPNNERIKAATPQRGGEKGQGHQQYSGRGGHMHNRHLDAANEAALTPPWRRGPPRLADAVHLNQSASRRIEICTMKATAKEELVRMQQSRKLIHSQMKRKEEEDHEEQLVASRRAPPLLSNVCESTGPKPLHRHFTDGIGEEMLKERSRNTNQVLNVANAASSRGGTQGNFAEEHLKKKGSNGHAVSFQQQQEQGSTEGIFKLRDWLRMVGHLRQDETTGNTTVRV